MEKLKEKKQSEEYILKRRQYEKQYRDRLKNNPEKLETFRKKKNEYLKKYRTNLNNNSVQETVDLPCIVNDSNWDFDNNDYVQKPNYSIYADNSLKLTKNMPEKNKTPRFLVKPKKEFNQFIDQADIERREKILKRRGYEKAYRERKKNDEAYKERQKVKNKIYLEKYKSEPKFIFKRLEYEKKYRDKQKFSKDYGSQCGEILYD